MNAVLDDPYILVVDGVISAATGLVALLEKVIETGKPLVVIAHDVDGDALATLVVNKVRETLSAVAVKAPGYGDHRRPLLEDLAIVSGGAVVTVDGLAGCDLTALGRARRVVVAKDETTIVAGAADEKLISDRVDELRAAIQRAESDYERDKLQERLAKLAGGVAVIMVGASSEAEMKASRALYERMVRATKLAVTEGIHPGGCVSLHRVAAEVRATAGDDDQGAGVRIVADALDEPYRQVIVNAGLPFPPTDGVVLDVVRGVPADLFADAIFDAQGILRVALEAAAEATTRFLRVA
jgi:chaperonin GroEL